ncbi:MAG TPA: GNAT family N-acetyltransferase [Pyrinomonadaceae bacterium]
MRINQAHQIDKTRSSFPVLTIVPDLSRVGELSNSDEQEVLAFLSVRPVHTVVMTSFIRDNRIESPLNRGKFFGYRNAAGKLEGVALIGHSTLVECRTEDALRALAFTARSSATPIHLIMSAGDVATSFWNYLLGPAVKPSLKCTELLFEIGFPFPVQKCDHDVRYATASELEAVAEAQAEVAEIECGVNPLLKDREGFLKRVLRRIEQQRVFVVFDGDELVFKADVIAQTDSVAYLEGVYVSPRYRGKGIGSKCLSKVCMTLLSEVNNVCLLSNTQFKDAHRSFVKAGMHNTDACTTLFV